SDFHESKFCIERHVPRYVSESRETYERMSSRGGPVTDCHYQPGTNASLSVIRVDINLFQMSDRGFEYFDVCKPNWNSFDQCDPKMAGAVRMLKLVEARRFGQYSIRCISNKEFGGSQLDCGQPGEIAPPSTYDRADANT